jgi:tetratricopeptide (TPR) repeat protein
LVFAAPRTEVAAFPAAGGSRPALALTALALLALIGCATAPGGAVPPANHLQHQAAKHPPADPWAQFQAGQYTAAETLLRAAAARCRQRQDERCELTNAIDLGVCQRALEELPAAEATLRRALTLARRPALRKYEAVAESNLATVLLALHRDRAAFELASAAADLAAGRRDQAVRADSLGVAALALVALGNAGGALAAATDAEAASRRIEDAQQRRSSMLRQAVTQAAIRRRLGDCARAEALFGEVLAAASSGALELEVEAHLGLARCARRQGDRALEREYLRQARVAANQHESALDSRARSAWRRQILALRAAEQEAGQSPGGPQAPGAQGMPRMPVTRPAIPPEQGYAFALLYESDGNSVAELRALLRVAAGTADSEAAAAMAAPLLDRVRVVTEITLQLRASPDDSAAVSQTLAPGTWIEVVSRSGGWMKVRTEIRSGFVKEPNGTGASLRPATAGD